MKRLYVSTHIAGLLAAVLSGFHIAPARAANFQLTQLTNNSVNDELPVVSGSNVAWRDNVDDTYQMFYYDGLSTTNIGTGYGVQFSPRISGDNVVWESLWVGQGVPAVFHYDGASTTILTYLWGQFFLPQVSGNNIVWQSEDEIYLHDGVTTTQLTTNSFPDSAPQVSGDNVVWQGNGEIYLYDGTTTTQLTSNSINDEGPQVSGDNVVWHGDGEIFFHDGTTTTQLTNNSFVDTVAQISGDNVVWQGNGEIYFYDGTTTTQLTSNNYVDSDPQVSGNNVVWHGDGEIFLYDGNSVTQLTSNSLNDVAPQVSGDNIVWQGNDGNDDEIFLATLLAAPAPNTPSNASLAAGTDVDVLNLDFGVFEPGESVAPLGFQIANLLSAGEIANLEFSSINGSGDVGTLTTNVTSLNTYLTTGGSLSAGMSLDFEAMLDTSTLGEFAATYELSFTDSLGTNQLLTLNLSGDVALTDDPNIPDLIYDAATGEVILDPDASTIIGYTLKNLSDSFLPGNHTPILPGVSTSLTSELAEAALSSGSGSIGNVFPAGMDLAQLYNLLSVNQVSTGLGAPLVPFDLIMLPPPVPEPSTYAMAAIALLGLGVVACRRRRVA